MAEPENADQVTSQEVTNPTQVLLIEWMPRLGKKGCEGKTIRDHVTLLLASFGHRLAKRTLATSTVTLTPQTKHLPASPQIFAS